MASTVKVDHTWNGRQTAHSYEVDFSLSASNGDMEIVINAPFHDDPPPPVSRGKLEGLHDFEVVEIFISGFPFGNDVADTPYLEIQVGPHGHYFLAFFMREADWVNQDTTLDFLMPPVINISHSTKRWHATLSIPSYYLPEPRCGDNFEVEWRANVCAIHGPANNREYLSAHRLPGNQPNFHQLACFAPVQLFETLEIRSTVDRTKSIVNDKLSLTPPKVGGVAGGGFGTSSPAFNVTEELRRAVLEESLLAVENQHATQAQHQATPNHHNRPMSIIAEEDMDGTESFTTAVTGLPVPPPAMLAAAQSPPPATPPAVVTIEQIARQLREKLLKRITSEDLDEACRRHLLQDEFVVLHSIVWKRRGLSYKKRRLILTSKPRLFYVNLSGEFKGLIPWSLTKRLQVVKRSDQKFDVTPSEVSRSYHFSDKALGADIWVETLTAIIQGQKQYLLASRTA